VKRAVSRDFVGARVVDPTLDLDAIRTIVVRNGVIAALRDDAPVAADPEVERVDCAGMVLCPGFIDPHVHLREPGDAHKETLASGLAAAAAGGFTAVAAMPNTRPAIDDAASIRRIARDAAAAGRVRTYVIGAVTRGRDGTTIAELRSMASAGAVAFSDDGSSTASLKALYNAALSIADLPQPFLSHCEDRSFGDGLMHDGAVADLLGVTASPSIAETAIAARDALVARATGKAWHLCHVSAAETIDVIRWAQGHGVRLTAEVTPHHLLCTDQALLGYDARMRVNPPLRSESDAAAMRRAVADGIITIFASVNAPHTTEEKEPPLSHACAGFSGLETAIGATFHALPDVALAVMVANFSTNVAALLGVAGGTLKVGSPADITGLYLDRPWTVEPHRFKSLGRVTPFAGMKFAVQPALAVVGGEIVV